jgi:hypothetical protein
MPAIGDGREHERLCWEDQETPIRGLTSALSRRGHEALQILAGRDQQRLAVDLLQPYRLRVRGLQVATDSDTLLITLQATTF